jgi:acetyl-CoA carboxylase biotin carboxylase subunit
MRSGVMSLKRLFVANRGEIAVRILRAAHQLGIQTVLGVSEADRRSLGAEMAGRVVVLGPASAARSYLDVGTVVHAAKATGCDALHPGYGFLSEKSSLARLCETQGMVFVGPRAETIEALGDKLAARALARTIGVPTVPGTDQVASLSDARRAAAELGYPVVMKASAGGGGRGMFKAAGPAELDASFDKASREAENAFGDGRLYLERFVDRARHVEVQIVGDGSGGVIHFGERDCSIQRRYQKLVEEAPAVALPAGTRARLHEAAVRLTSHARYRNAGTVEFLYDLGRDDFYFMEVNSRIQVEHPVTEETTGHDLVAWQLRIAAGEGLSSLEQQGVELAGHAIECRVNAEDPRNGFLPSPGRITHWRPPSGEGIRLDTHARQDYLIPPYYDSMIGKLIARGRDRDEAIMRLARALDEFVIEGPKTTLTLARAIVGHPDFRNNQLSIRWLEDRALPQFLADADVR